MLKELTGLNMQFYMQSFSYFQWKSRTPSVGPITALYFRISVGRVWEEFIIEFCRHNQIKQIMWANRLESSKGLSTVASLFLHYEGGDPEHGSDSQGYFKTEHTLLCAQSYTRANTSICSVFPGVTWNKVPCSQAKRRVCVTRRASLHASIL